MTTYQKKDFPVAKVRRYPKTVHYRGGGVFMIAGENKSYRHKFVPENL